MNFNIPTFAPIEGLPEVILLGFMGVIIIVFGVHAGVLSYHWFKYNTETHLTWGVLAVYLLVSAILLVGMALSAIFFSATL